MRQARTKVQRHWPLDDGLEWKYSLSQPTRNHGRWRHYFVVASATNGHDSSTNHHDVQAVEHIESTKIFASKGWVPANSGVRLVLRDVCIGADAAELVERPTMLGCLAAHLAGQSIAAIDAPGLTGGQMATSHVSPEGVRYFIYSVQNFGPTHIFTERER